MANVYEIDITDFFNTAAPMDYSASVAEIGNDAGPSTWRAACEDSEDYPLLDNDEKRNSFRDYVHGFGAWTDAEIAAWTNSELTALFIQLISGDMREFNELAKGDWQIWQELCEAGTCTGNLYGGPLSVDGRVYYYIGN